MALDPQNGRFAIGGPNGFSFGAEIDSAAFLGNDKIVVASTEEVINEDIPATGIGPRITLVTLAVA
jgi:hypothetical protein